MFIKTVICNQYSNSFEAKQENKLPVNKAKFIVINKNNNAFITTNSLKVAQKYNKNAVYAVYEVNYSYMITYRINENTPLFFCSLREVETRYFSFKCILTQDNNAMRSIKLDKAIKAYQDSDIIKNASKISFKVETEKSWVYSIDNTSTCIFINKNTLESYISTFKQRYTIKDLLKKYNCNKSELKSNLKYMLMKKIVDYDSYTATNIFVKHLKLMLGYSKKRILDIFKNNPQCISTVKNILDSISIEKKEYITNKENYHKNNNNDLEKLNDKMLNSTIKNTALYNYLIDDDTTNCFTNSELYQQIKLVEIEAKKKSNNIIDNIYSYHFLSYLLTHKTESQVYTSLKNKDIVYYFNDLLNIRLSIYKAINNCKVEARKNKLMYYYHCLNCINEINEKYQSDLSLKELENNIFNSENLKQEYCLSCDC